MGILQVKDLTLKLGETTVLDRLTIDFWEGHVHAVVGPNGAGKSTMAYSIMGLSDYRHHEGDILLEGESIKALNIDERARKGISLAWQEPARFEGLKVETFIKAGGRGKEGRTADEVLNMVGLDPGRYKSRAVDRTLSGGERKRIELASILMMQPRIFLMDEPDSGIDMEALKKIFEVIEMLKKEKTTIILITHSLEVLRQAEHAFLLCHGEVIDKGPAKKIIYYFENNCLPCNHKNEPLEEERP